MKAKVSSPLQPWLLHFCIGGRQLVTRLLNFHGSSWFHPVFRDESKYGWQVLSFSTVPAAGAPLGGVCVCYQWSTCLSLNTFSYNTELCVFWQRVSGAAARPEANPLVQTWFTQAVHICVQLSSLLTLSVSV